MVLQKFQLDPMPVEAADLMVILKDKSMNGAKQIIEDLADAQWVKHLKMYRIVAFRFPVTHSNAL